MNAKLIGLFSGFPTHHFTDEIAEVLRENLDKRKCLVFISADPENYTQNDDDENGMHQMFTERDMVFTEHHVIDRRTSAEDAADLIRQADCIWLMGGEVTWQMKLIRDLNLIPELLESNAVILGVSAGSMNLGKYVAELWESKSFYEGIALTDFIIKAHYEPDAYFIPALKEMSMLHPIIAMEDESAIFIKHDEILKIGKMHRVDKGKIYD
ncbi:MAG: Type 1 glutamine amidotransferase-like domain-containing protein [Spirochaetales bacterium]|nr:Type 1 glutamine amidotransferase-like domain-containing protein [Spirochaetales bacterium]